MHLKNISPCHGIDTPAAMTADLCAKFRDAGYSFVVRYVTRWRSCHDEPEPDIGNWFYGLSKAELRTILDSGLALGIVQAMKKSAELTYQNGTVIGLNALDNCKKLGIPNGATVFCDAEFNDAPTVDVVAYLTGWQEAVRTAYRPGLYVGYEGLAGADWYNLPGFACYWRAGMAYLGDPYPRSFSMYQTVQKNIFGIDTDVNIQTYDNKRDRPYFVVS